MTFTILKEIINDPEVDSKAAAELVSGFCKYQGRGINGQMGFSRLDGIPQRIIKRGAPNVVSYMEPRANSSDYTLLWWIEGDNPNEVHPANHVIGKQLQLADVRTPLTRIPSVEIRAMVFSLDQTKEREIGLNIAANFAKTPDDGPGPFDQNAINVGAGAGLLNIVGGVSDAMASAIQIGSESFSRELYGKLIIPFIENGLVRLISQVVASRWVWPASESMQTIGTESKFLKELIVIRNEVNQAKTNPAVLSLVDVKLSVIIKEIQRNDSREVTWFLDHEESFKGRHTLRVKKVKTDWMLLGSEEFYVDGLERTPARYQSDFAGFGVQDALVSFQKLVKEDIRSAMCPDCAENSLFAGDDK